MSAYGLTVQAQEEIEALVVMAFGVGLGDSAVTAGENLTAVHDMTALFFVFALYTTSPKMEEG